MYNELTLDRIHHNLRFYKNKTFPVVMEYGNGIKYLPSLNVIQFCRIVAIYVAYVSNLITIYVNITRNLLNETFIHFRGYT